MNISVKQSRVDPGSEVVIDVDLTNILDKEIEIIHVNGPPVYVFKVLDRNGKAAPLTPAGEAIVSGRNCYKGKKGETRCFMGGSTITHRVPPGGTLHDIFVLSAYVDLSQPNQYTVRLERTDPYTKLLVVSNTITLSVAKKQE